MPTGTAIQQEMVAPLGGHYGDIASGGATTAVVSELIGFNDIAVGDLLLMPDASTAADQMRTITAWAPSTGTFTWADNRADTTYTSETFILLPAKVNYTLQQIRQAINDTLQNTQRATRFTIATREVERRYPLTDLSWLRSHSDVELVERNNSPALLDNDEFTKWQNGASSAPDGWTLAGAGASVARATTFAAIGPYTVQLTRSGADATLVQNVPHALARQLINDLADVAIDVRVQTATASAVRVGINDGVDTTWSSYHSGDGEWERLTATRTLTAAASRVQIVLSVDTGNGTGDFDFVASEEGAEVQDALTDVGSSGFDSIPVRNQIIDVGGVPVIELAHELGRGHQLIVTTRREFATLSADTGTTELDLETAAHGALFRLYRIPRAGENRTRPDERMAYHGRIYMHRASQLINRPRAVSMRQNVVVGA